MRVLLRQLAAVCIVASVLPQVESAAAALHAHLDHGAEQVRSVPLDSVIPALHGHAHSFDTPDHEHPLTAPFSDSVATHGRGPLRLALPVGCGGVCAPCAAVDLLALSARSANQRPAPVIPTVLRI